MEDIKPCDWFLLINTDVSPLNQSHPHPPNSQISTWSLIHFPEGFYDLKRVYSMYSVHVQLKISEGHFNPYLNNLYCCTRDPQGHNLSPALLNFSLSTGDYRCLRHL